MSDTTSELTNVLTNVGISDPEPGQAPPVETAPGFTAEPEQALNVEDDAAVDLALQQSAIDLPDGDTLVPTSQAGKIAGAYRGKIKELKAELENAKTGSARAQELEQQVQQLAQQVQQLQPYVQAYQAMTQAAQTAAEPEDTSDAQEYAQLLDLYTPEGKPDIARAKKAMGLLEKLADKRADQKVAPLQQQTAAERSATNLQRAKNTVLPNGAKADPSVLENVWSRLDPAVTSTKEGAQQALMVAIGYSQAFAPAQAAQPAQPRPRTPTGQFQPATPSEPLFVEKAGGKDSPNTLPLSPQEQKFLKDVGMSEKEYLASTPPWMRR